ncbi:hypothetical protein LIER_07316 [Lithospermum erythrorhizon]|uniref:Uncharacterized protein n=1 Tax=Lithospermum erythrorhizon TaxID=34254 RepID=A0AAV3P865_LITER
MAMAFDHFSWWFRGKGKNQKLESLKGDYVKSLPDSGLLEVDTVNFPLVDRVDSSSRRIKRKRHSREERKVDKEFDVVLVPSDGGCVSGSESDDSDYSVGWLEPHGPSFQSDEDSEDSFAVIVPCYGRCRGNLEDDKKGTFLNDFSSISGIYAADGNRFLEQWLSSLQNSYHG